MVRIASTVSRARVSRCSKLRPCQPLMMASDDTPMPSANRPGPTASTAAVPLASIGAVRGPIWMMHVPSRIREVAATESAHVTKASGSVISAT